METIYPGQSLPKDSGVDQTNNKRKDIYMRVYLAIYDDRVAGAFDEFDKCMTFIRSRAMDEVHHSTIKKGFTRFEYDDERGNHHVFYETDHEIK